MEEVLDFVLRSLPAPPARVLEVGAGRGELAAALRELGYDVLAIDSGGAAPGVERVALAELDEPPASFDAAVAVRSLHHVNPLAESCARLADVVRPGGRLVIDEFDVERLDERAAGWLIEQLRSPQEPAAFVEMMRAHLHPVALLREVLSRGFRLGDVVRGAYLYRWELLEDVGEEEERLIAAGDLPAIGARFTGTRS
jgi:SAM-dependent methyltransferase